MRSCFWFFLHSMGGMWLSRRRWRSFEMWKLDILIPLSIFSLVIRCYIQVIFPLTVLLWNALLVFGFIYQVFQILIITLLSLQEQQVFLIPPIFMNVSKFISEQAPLIVMFLNWVKRKIAACFKCLLMIITKIKLKVIWNTLEISTIKNLEDFI